MEKETLKLIKDIKEINLNLNSYYDDSEYISIIDELLAGKIKGLLFNFRQLGFTDLADTIEEYSLVRRDGALSTLEFLKTSIFPAAITKLSSIESMQKNEQMKLGGKDRLNLIEMISSELQATMTTTDINVYLGGFGVENDGTTVASSKRVYSKGLLSSVDDRTVINIALDLGIEIPSREISGTLHLRSLLDGTGYAHAQSDFRQALLDVDIRPENAIGLASTTLESICKAILDSFEEPYPRDESLQSLQKAVITNMELSPEGQADSDIKRILGGLINVGAGIATLRTKYSSFHGKGRKQYRLGKRHAKLAVNSLTTTGLFLLETYQERYGNRN